VSVEEVTDNNMDGYIRVMLRGWSLPPDEGDVERRVLHAAFGMQPRTAFCFVARLGSEIVGTAALALRGDYAYLLGTQVLESARGHGVYRALVSARLAFLRGRGIEYAVTQAREATSAPMLEHLGFETLFRSKCYLRAVVPP
jgi:GNAT superfamily N-acetyltransferase